MNKSPVTHPTTRQFPLQFTTTKPVPFFPEIPNGSLDILEIGPGRGDFLLEYTAAVPHKKMIAIELGKKRFLKLIERVKKTTTNNITLACGDARAVLTEHLKEHRFSEIYVLFPDPWPKNKHSFRRLLTTEFITLLAHHLTPNGVLIMGTDSPEYAHEIIQATSAVVTLKNTGTPFITDSPLPIKLETYFEKKWRTLGKNIFFMKYVKNHT